MGTDAGSWQRLIACCDEVKRVKDLKLVYKESDFKKSSFGVQYLLDTLREVRDSVEETGELDDLILKRVVLECIATQQKRLKDLASILAENEASEESAKTALSHLPSKEVVDKLLRYETTLERQIYRALNELEHRQRQRRGESVPPPVSIQVSTPALREFVSKKSFVEYPLPHFVLNVQ